MLHVHRAERADGLVGALRELLAAPPADPFAPEVVAVPTRGMERWLTQQLSTRLGARRGHGDGVCGNVRFPAPAALLGDAVAAATGVAADADPWAPDHAVWPLLAVVDEAVGEPWAAVLARHLGCEGDEPDPVRRARRLPTAQRLAERFDRIALHRPGLLAAWREAGDGGWQAELWRRLRDRVGGPDPVERLALGCARLREDPARAALPERLALFGLTRLPPGHLDVLRALAAARDVHLLLLHPSPALWQALREAPRVTRRRDDPTAAVPANPLLASWGRDARELQLVLQAPGNPLADHHHAVDHGAPSTLLARVQAAVRADRRPEPAPLDPEDRSLAVHACHGRARQVEVLRDAILHLLEDDPALEPRDVVVMCPDIEAFAPLVHATFGTAAEAGDDDLGLPDLRVRLADRALRQTNPVLGAVAALLELADARVTASQVLELADREPVRRCFAFDDDDLGRVQGWIADAGIRWGLDAGHRAPFGLASVDAGTWRRGLDRLLLGVTMTEEGARRFGEVLPVDDVGSGDIDLAGRVAELVDRLAAAVDALRGPQPLGAWTAAIAAAADALTATRDRDAWQRAELDRLLADVEAEAAGDLAAELSLGEVRALLGERLQGRPTRANFRTGHLTFCTLMPMRSVPHRVVCLLGLDDEAFPRPAPRDGDDPLLDDPHIGDRDPRSEDRQLLLDALLAAQDRLVITCTGHDERTNAPRPPAVPVDELLDVVDRTATTDDGRPARERVVVHHPLQPFAPRAYEPGGVVPGRPWGFDRVTLDGARALTAPRAVPAPFLAAPLPDPGDAVLELDDLVRFAEHPARALLRRRLGIGVRDFADEVQDELPVELDHLARYGVGQRLLEARLAGVEEREAIRAEIARGTLPPGVIGKPVVHDVWPVVEGIATRAEAVVAGLGPPQSLQVDVALPDGRALRGTVAGISGDVLRTATYARIAPKHRLAAWARLLALSAAHPGRRFEAVTIGRARRGASDREAAVSTARLGPLAPTAAREGLLTLVALFDAGMREPIALPTATAATYVAAGRAGRDPEEAARRVWEGGFDRPGEAAEAEHELVHGARAPLEALLDRGLEELAERLWSGVLDAEQVSDA